MTPCCHLPVSTPDERPCPFPSKNEPLFPSPLQEFVSRLLEPSQNQIGNGTTAKCPRLSLYLLPHLPSPCNSSNPPIQNPCSSIPSSRPRLLLHQDVAYLALIRDSRDVIYPQRRNSRARSIMIPKCPPPIPPIPAVLLTPSPTLCRSPSPRIPLDISRPPPPIQFARRCPRSLYGWH